MTNAADDMPEAIYAEWSPSKRLILASPHKTEPGDTRYVHEKRERELLGVIAEMSALLELYHGTHDVRMKYEAIIREARGRNGD